MNKSRAYFEFLDEFKGGGCPICSLLMKDSHRYLDHLFYESVLDVPIRMKLMQSFGLCSWHTWQIPALPAICSPQTGYSIFASDLLRKFVYLASSTQEETRKKRTLKSLLRKSRHQFASRMKEKACPACSHVGQFESYRLKELLDFIGDREFLEAYRASSGICLPHFIMAQENYCAHDNLPLLLAAQVAIAQFVRDTLEEFIRKQDYRFRDEITPAEEKAWRVAMEFLAGKPGVFTNEMGHELLQKSHAEKTSPEKISLQLATFSKLTLDKLIDDMGKAKTINFYLKQPLPSDLFKELKELAAGKFHPEIEFVIEDLNDVEYLRSLYASRFTLFYGIGLPYQTIILVDRKRGYLLDAHRGPGRNLRSLKNPEDFYLSLLWRRFGIAVSLSGWIKETDTKSKLFCLVTEGQREQWCRFKDADARNLPEVGANIEIFGWEKWNSRVVEVLDCTESGAKG